MVRSHRCVRLVLRALPGFAVVCSPSLAVAEPVDVTLDAFAVHIHQTPMQSWGPGAGIFLGGNLFITAAHVAGRTWWTRPRIVSRGEAFPTRTVQEGTFEGTDVTLLSVDRKVLPMRFQLRRLSLCTKPPVPGQDVVTVIPGAAMPAHILAPERLPADVRRFSTVIAEVDTTGNSGSGVFDSRSKCLMGIMSRKISVARRGPDGVQRGVQDIAKYFVPASTIATLLPAPVVP